MMEWEQLEGVRLGRSKWRGRRVGGRWRVSRRVSSASGMAWGAVRRTSRT